MIDTINTQRVNRRIYMYQRFIPSSENRSLAPVLIMVAIGDIKKQSGSWDCKLPKPVKNAVSNSVYGRIIN